MREGELSREEIDLLADEIAETSAVIDATTHTLLTKIRHFDEAEGWGLQGALSCAHWLNWRIGMSLGAAREHVRVASRLGELPLIDDALRKGEVSYSKVRAMSRVATSETEETLLEMARCSTAAQLEKICRLYRRVKEGEEVDASNERDRRWVQRCCSDDGMVRITASLHPDEAERVMKAIEAHAEASGDRHFDRADGLVALADQALDESESGKPPIEATVRVEVDATTLTGCYEDGTGVPAGTCRRLLCDSSVVALAEDEAGNPLSVGRKRRTVSTALRRALRIRDKTCRFPGCSHTRFLDAHHVRHWIDGGETSLENTLSLCRSHHRYVHEYGFHIELLDDGELAFIAPDGRRVPEGGMQKLRQEMTWERMRAAMAKNGIVINPMTNIPNWDGSNPDYSMAIDGLLYADKTLPA